MTTKLELGLAAIQQQMRELDEISKQTMDDLNTVAGTERVAKWKTRTAALLSQAVGEKEGLAFARQQPGPSFTNDLVEEFSDLVEQYHTALQTLMKKLRTESAKTD